MVQKTVAEILREKSDEELIGNKDLISGVIGGINPSYDYLIDMLRRNMEMQKRLKDATNKSSRIMMWLNIVLIILTAVLVWLTLVLVES